MNLPRLTQNDPNCRDSGNSADRPPASPFSPRQDAAHGRNSSRPTRTHSGSPRLDDDPVE